jgi:REP element-mobilizing transposase RayT
MAPNTLPRVKGLGYRGLCRYFVTTCTHRRLRWLGDEHAARRIVEQLLPFFEARGFAVVAYCLMPDHVHLLLEGTAETADLAEAIRAWKQRTGFDWKQRTGARLWQEGFMTASCAIPTIPSRWSGTSSTTQSERSSYALSRTTRGLGRRALRSSNFSRTQVSGSLRGNHGDGRRAV